MVALALLCIGAAFYLFTLRPNDGKQFRGTHVSAPDATLCFALMLAATVLSAVFSYSQWEGSARILLARTLPFFGFILVPIAVAVGCFVGQRRHRWGVVQWEKTAPGGSLRAFLATSLRAVLVTGGGYALGTAILLIFALPLLDAPAALEEWGISWVLIALGGLIGCSIGWLIGHWLASPLCAVACVLSLTLSPVFETPFHYTDPTLRTANLYCQGDTPTVCGFRDNKSYVDALSGVTETKYEKSGLEAVLPHRIVLIDDGAEHPDSTFAYLGRMQLDATQRDDIIPAGSFWDFLFAENAGRCSNQFHTGFDQLRTGDYPATPEERLSAATIFRCLR